MELKKERMSYGVFSLSMIKKVHWISDKLNTGRIYRIWLRYMIG